MQKASRQNVHSSFSPNVVVQEPPVASRRVCFCISFRSTNEHFFLKKKNPKKHHMTPSGRNEQKHKFDLNYSFCCCPSGCLHSGAALAAALAPAAPPKTSQRFHLENSAATAERARSVRRGSGSCHSSTTGAPFYLLGNTAAIFCLPVCTERLFDLTGITLCLPLSTPPPQPHHPATPPPIECVCVCACCVRAARWCCELRVPSPSFRRSSKSR